MGALLSSESIVDGLGVEPGRYLNLYGSLMMPSGWATQPFSMSTEMEKVSVLGVFFFSGVVPMQDVEFLKAIGMGSLPVE